MRTSFGIGPSFALALIVSACGGAPEDAKSSDTARPEDQPNPTPEPAPEQSLPLAEQGRRNFRMCAACHSVGDPNAAGTRSLIGPNLFEIVGAPSGRQEGYAYSKAMAEADLVWDLETLDAFIANPQESGARQSNGICRRA